MVVGVHDEGERRLAVLELSKAGRPPEEEPACEAPV
jgi:hypothetical protein